VLDLPYRYGADEDQMHIDEDQVHIVKGFNIHVVVAVLVLVGAWCCYLVVGGMAWKAARSSFFAVDYVVTARVVAIVRCYQWSCRH
jgi:hypothetical protein